MDSGRLLKNDYYLGFDIGGTKCAVIAGTPEMEILHRIQFPTNSGKGPDQAINGLLEHSGMIIRQLVNRKPLAIGISCGGPLDSKRGIIQSPPNLPGWDDIEIVRIFEDWFQVPVFLQNDANACALAEWRFGAGKGTRNMIFLTFGTGMGAGLILDGRLFSGTNDLAGEVGHVRLADEGPEGYGKPGSFEGFCSGGGIARLARMLIQEKVDEGEKVALLEGGRSLAELTTQDLATAALSGDPDAIGIFELSGRYLGKGLSILIDILNPERIVIGSVFERNPQLFYKACLDVIEKEALAPARAVCEIVPAALGDRIGDFACLSVAMSGDQ
jgi:glucokinase